MTRIIAGRFRGRRLRSPRGAQTRPTADRVKQTLFDILTPVIPACRFLDPFAGAGGVGLEALSRGARLVVLVDRDAAAVAAIRENQALLAAGGEVQVFRQDARVAIAALADRGVRFDVIYLDPPYASDFYEPLLEQLDSQGVVETGGLVVAEHFHKRGLPETIGSLVRTRSVKVGDQRLTFYRRAD